VSAQEPAPRLATTVGLAVPRRRSLQVPATRRAILVRLIAVSLILAGCAASRASAPTSAAAEYASNTPPAAAQMVCSDEIRGLVTGALALDSVPAPQSTWADHVYTCTYQPPAGPLVLAVTVAPTNTAAGDQLERVRAQLGATEPEPGLGQRAYGAPNGTILAVKDNMMLSIDATALPDDLGLAHERRIDLARILAAGVFNCWIGKD
jgi:hypothetical protein